MSQVAERSNKFYLYGLYAVAGSMALPWDHLFYLPLFLVWMYQYRNSLGNALKLKESIACIALFCLFLIGMTYTQDFEHGLATMEKRYFWLINLWLLTGVVFLSDKEIWSIYQVFAWGIVLALIYCLMMAVVNTIEMGEVVQFNKEFGVYENNFLYHKLSANIGIHAIVLSVYVAFAFHILLKDYSALDSTKRKLLLILTMLFLAVCIFLLQSAMIMAAFVASLLIVAGNYVYKHPPKRKRMVALISAIALIAVIFTSINVVNKLDFKKSIISYCIEDNPDQFNGLNLRLALWWSSGHIIKDNFWFGVGTGDLDLALYEYYDKLHFHFAKRELLHAHNQFLHTPTLVGIFGLLLLIYIFLRGFYQSISKRDVLFFLFIFVFVCHSITDSSLTSNKGIMYFTFFYFLWLYSTVREGMNAASEVPQ